MKTKWIYIVISIIVGIIICLFIIFNFLKGKGLNSIGDYKNDIPRVELIEENGKKYLSIPIFYGTNRKKVENYENKIQNLKQIENGKVELFSGKVDDIIHYGYFRASIPIDVHEKGKLEQANFIENLQGKKFNPTKYINILNYNVMGEDDFQETIKGSIESNNNQAFIFIHGYNNSFESAALRTAQLFYDMQYDGVPIMYSWPSVARTQGYFTDGKNINKSIALFKTFIKNIAEKNEGKKLNIIAHSMGNRLLVQAISELNKEHPEIKFENIIMAAPDVPREDFTKKHVNNMVKFAKNINLYCSKKDKALQLSKILNMQSRLGTADTKIFKKKPVFTIDISNNNDCEDILAHTCFAQTNYVIDDISSVLKQTELKRSEKNGIIYLKN